MGLGALGSDNCRELGRGNAERRVMRRWADAVATKKIPLTVTDMMWPRFFAHYGRLIRALWACGMERERW